MECVLKYQKMNSNAFDLSKGSSLSAGFDLKSSEDYQISPKGKCVCKTGLKIHIPSNCYGRIGTNFLHFVLLINC